MNYYNEIKNELINNEVNRKVKEYAINRSDIETYCKVGKLLLEAGNKYGEGIIRDYSVRLTNDIGKKYSVRYLFDIRKLYIFIKVHPVGSLLTISHYRLLFKLHDNNEINYYIGEAIKRNLSKRQLQEIIKNKEYERLPESTKNKLINKEETSIEDNIKNPIIIRNNSNDEINEKLLQKLILEDITNFMKELGNGYSFIDNEYKIKIGNSYNYIDLLFYNIIFNCYVVVELKVTELKKEHIGQIQVYMNYIDNNLKTINQNKTIGIIICRQDNEYVIKYSSDERIIAREYELLS